MTTNEPISDNQCSILVAKIWASAILTVVLAIIAMVTISSWNRNRVELEYAKACFAAQYKSCPYLGKQ